MRYTSRMILPGLGVNPFVAAVLSVLAATAGLVLSDATGPSASSLAVTALAVALLAISRTVAEGPFASPKNSPQNRKANASLLSFALLAWSVLLLLIFVSQLSAALMALAAPALWILSRRRAQRELRLNDFMASWIICLPALVGGAAAERVPLPAAIIAAVLFIWSMTHLRVSVLLETVESGQNVAIFSPLRDNANRQLILYQLELVVLSLLPALLLPRVAAEPTIGALYIAAAAGLAAALVAVGISPLLRTGRMRGQRLAEVLHVYPVLLMSALILDYLLR